MENGDSEDGRVAVRVDFEYFFFYCFVVLFDGFTKEDHFIGFFDVVLSGRPEVLRVHGGNDVDTPREPFFEEMPPDVLGLRF